MQTEMYERLVKDFLEEGTTDEILFTGISSEAGEVMQERAKEVRKSEDRSRQILDELSDVLWYVTMIAKTRGSSLEKLMMNNFHKLEARAINGK
jgi:NTP pyrophosphatase (non-canonical NTP hydrolase)